LTLANIAAIEASASCEAGTRAYQFVTTWLPLISGLNPDERQKLELRLQELRLALERLRSETQERHLVGA